MLFRSASMPRFSLIASIEVPFEGQVRTRSGAISPGFWYTQNPAHAAGN
jgi:hypothetical protein